MFELGLIKHRKSNHFKTFYLPADQGHKVGIRVVGPFEQGGLEAAQTLEDLKKIMIPEKPVLLHWTGGPGLAVPAGITRVVNTRHFHLLQINYRGTVESTPTGKTESNTTQDIINDGLRLLDELAIKEFYMSGFCFGTLIATIMASHAAERCKGLGLFFPYTSSRLDDQWLFDAIQHSDPEKLRLWQSFSMKAQPSQRSHYLSLLRDYSAAVRDGDIEAIKKYAIYQSTITGCINIPEGTNIDHGLDDLHLTKDQENQTLMELHYGENQYFLGPEGVLPFLPKLKDIPTQVVYSSQNASFHPESIHAWKKNLPTAQYRDTGSKQHHMLDHDHLPFARNMFAFLEEISKSSMEQNYRLSGGNLRFG